MRQNTPHPKELKAKAHKLFGKDKKDDESNILFPLAEEVRWRSSVSVLSCATQFSSFQSQRTDISAHNASNATPVEAIPHHFEATTVVRTEIHNHVVSPNDVSWNII